jgi:hypothetical protein
MAGSRRFHLLVFVFCEPKPSLSQLTQIDPDQFAHAKGRFFDFSDTEHASICMYTLPTYCTSGAKEKPFQVSSTLSMANDATLMLKSNIANNK